ncbi:MAG: hypothetical protein JWM59_5139, partial [Verrucomicrobiales bacterium]|nr:hypothetical protein [Verrucomicrobiales bacterium]
AGSPAINAGINPSARLGALFLQQFGYDLKFTDRAGTPRGTGGAWDIGAYEYNGASTEVTPSPVSGLRIVPE